MRRTWSQASPLIAGKGASALLRNSRGCRLRGEREQRAAGRQFTAYHEALSRHNARFATLEAICRELDCKPGDILDLEAEKPEPPTGDD